MALETAVVDINSVPEGSRSLYVKKDDHYILDTTTSEIEIGGVKRSYGVDDIGTLRATISRQKSDIVAEQQKSIAFEGLNAADVRRSLVDLETLRGESGDLDQKVKSLAQSQIDQMAAQWKVEKEGLEKTSSGAITQLEKVLIDNELSKAIIAAGGNEGTITLLSPHFKNQIQTVKTGDTYGYQVMDLITGTPAIGDANGSPMTLTQLVESAKKNDIFAAAFPATGQSGGGSSSSGGSGGSFPQKKSDFSAEQRTEFIQSKGFGAWASLTK